MLMTEKIYTVKEIAESYRVSEETIRRYIRQGKLEKVGGFEGAFRVSESALEKFFKRKPEDVK